MHLPAINVAVNLHITAVKKLAPSPSRYPDEIHYIITEKMMMDKDMIKVINN